MWDTPIKDLKVKQLPAAFGRLCLLGVAGGFLTVLFLGLIVVAKDTYSADDLARQIANGTHRVEWDDNKFDTREVRIVEVE